ncbi:MAG: hypothetical protein Q7S33_00775 [Nanoarchaeota archaeon]|nr:hypothetical protein [Nanoarchaeota archaeon]
MEKLEKISELSLLNAEKSDRKEIPYEGLTLIEERPYNGPTSIKYWM